TMHKELAMMLKAVGYQGFVSVEMRTASLRELQNCLEYVVEVFA
ncbi:hypothetical protein EVA_14803, partial [gut metagenome]